MDYFSKPNKLIQADGIGYYDYLPSIFIHKDLMRKDADPSQRPERYDRINDLPVYVSYEVKKINKYPIGTAVLQSPFFLINYWLNGSEENHTGYEQSYHITIRVAALFYLILGLILLSKLFLLYNIDAWVIPPLLVLITFATPLFWYKDNEVSFSHTYSFFAVNLFCYCLKKLLLDNELKYFIGTSIAFGLVAIIRNIGLVILGFIPFLAADFKEIKHSWKRVWQSKKHLILGFFLFTLISSTQLIVWYLQSGHWLVYSNQNEGFIYWSEPRIAEVLFGYRKGLFLYTPVLLLAALGLIGWLIRRKFYAFGAWILFFMGLTYIMASWWSWWYGASFGLRPCINYYVIFAIPLAWGIQYLGKKKRTPVFLVLILFTGHNLMQAYQYQNRILHWHNMDKASYWKVFGKVISQYAGILYKEQFTFEWMTLEDVFELGDIGLKPRRDAIALSISSKDLSNFADLRAFRIEADAMFSEDDTSMVEVKIKEDSRRIYWQADYTLLMQEEGADKWQRGYLNYLVPPLDDHKEVQIEVLFFACCRPAEFKNARVKIYSQEYNE